MNSNSIEPFGPYRPQKALPMQDILRNNRENELRLRDNTEVREDTSRSVIKISDEQLVEIGSIDTMAELTDTLHGDMRLKKFPQSIECPPSLVDSFKVMRVHSDMFDQETQQVVAVANGDLCMLASPLATGCFYHEKGVYDTGEKIILPDWISLLADVHSHPRGKLAYDSGVAVDFSEEDIARKCDNYSVKDVMSFMTKNKGSDTPNASILVGTSHITMLVRSSESPKKIEINDSKKSVVEVRELFHDLVDILDVDAGKAVHPQNLANLRRLNDEYKLAVYRMDIRKPGPSAWKKLFN